MRKGCIVDISELMLESYIVDVRILHTAWGFFNARQLNEQIVRITC